MNVLFVATEAVPFAKTGGLADVIGALPRELSGLGHPTSLVMPYFRQVRQAAGSVEPLGVTLSIPIGTKQVEGALLAGRLPGSEVPVYFVQQDGYFDRPGGLYGSEPGRDYADNCERFVFFCRAAMEAIRLLDLPVDILHLHDWQTALMAAYLKTEYRHLPGYDQIASAYTIHNLAYQGRFWHWDMLLTGLDWKYFNWRQMEFWGDLNLMKTGLVFADVLTTVSPTYAQEIQTAEQGCGLEGVLQQRRQLLHGIINGVDYEQWDPAHDRHLAATYGPDSFDVGKPRCKEALQRELQLPPRDDVPMVGIVGRLADQKGWDLIAPVIERWAPTQDVQWAVLGTGDPRYHEMLSALARRHPQRVAVRLDFSDAVAHRIEAGADLFLMPSRFEPCGLNQLYSLRYGTVPVVRRTGGLADTIVDTNEQSLANGTATGFSFADYTSQALDDTLTRALAAYRRPEVWDQLVARGMRQDWSWRKSARDYVELYQQTLQTLRQPTASLS